MKNSKFLKVGFVAVAMTVAMMAASNASAQEASVQSNMDNVPQATQAVDGPNPLSQMGSAFGSFLKKVGSGIEKMADNTQQNMETPAASVADNGKTIEKAEAVSSGTMKPVAGVTINTDQIKSDVSNAISKLRGFFNSSQESENKPSGP